MPMVANLKAAEQSSLKREVSTKEQIKQTAAWSNGMGVCAYVGMTWKHRYQGWISQRTIYSQALRQWGRGRESDPVLRRLQLPVQFLK